MSIQPVSSGGFSGSAGGSSSRTEKVRRPFLASWLLFSLLAVVGCGEGPPSRGEAVYHGEAACSSCHPAYLDYAALAVQQRRVLGFAPSALDSSAYLARPQEDSQGLVRLPTDFLREELQSGESARALEGLVRHGLPGTTMVGWEGRLPEEDIRALVDYLRWLIERRGTPAGEKILGNLADQPSHWP